jgi:glycosyltransferase involved in cell wall biosynthesis
MAHIGIDARLNYYRVGGISTYTRQLVSALEKLDYENRYTVFHSRKMHDSLVKRFRRAALWTPCHHRIERLALSVELTRFRLDIFHSPDFIPPLRGAKRHVITVHDLAFLLYPQFMTEDSRRYYNAQIQSAVDRADHILAVSEATKRDLISMLNVPASKITVQLEGVDEGFKPLPPEIVEQACKRYDLPSEYFLFVSTLEPRKNISGLLKGYAELRRQVPDALPLLMIGKRGWLFDETQLQQAGVIWRESVSHEDLPAVYNRALALVLPSHYEGFGLPALEAMACGTVPIVSNRSSLPEVVGDVGIQVEPDDPMALANALLKTLTDKSWRDKMQKSAIARAQQFTWSRAAEIALAVYRGML